MLQIQYCRQRQQRLAHEALGMLDAVVLGAVPNVYYFSGHLPFWLHQPAALLDRTGKFTLCSANKPAAQTAADKVLAYEANWNGTLRMDQPFTAAMLIADEIRQSGARRVGIDASAITSQLPLLLGGEVEFMPLDPTLHQLRRAKDPDEMELIAKAMACCRAMYDRAKQIIRPGVTELEVFTELNQAAVLEAGEPLTALLGNDYACGVGGGPARSNRPARDGEIYILDLGPCYRGYFSDNCRAFAVNGKPTDAQLQAWQTLTQVFPLVQRLAKPGVKCRDIYTAVDEHLRPFGGLKHHLGHGVGLFPHEYPHLNHKWDDTLAEGDFFTVEPGIYAPNLAAGIRLENNYFVTRTGVQEMLNYPLELA